MRAVTVVGAGAAGLAASIAAAEAGARVTLHEAGQRAGKSILVTGNGRCNLTNMRLSAGAYNAPDFVAPSLDAHGPEETRSWFERLGLLTREGREGRVYPLSNTANSVADVLRLSCARLGVRILVGSKVESLEGLEGDAVVVATGGGSTLLASAGHALEPFSPVLCSLSCETAPLRGLSGVRADALVSVYEGGGSRLRARERGEVQFKDGGVSGVVIFDLSRFACPGDVLELDLIPDVGEEELSALLAERFSRFGAASGKAPTWERLLAGMFHSRLNGAVVRAAGEKLPEPAREEGLPGLAHACKHLRTAVLGPLDPTHAQVTRGGARLAEFDAVTLSSKLSSRLFAAGEALDVDGPCGGYNLQWAWSSGRTAGEQAARG